MQTYIIRRLLLILPTVFIVVIVTVIVFFSVRLIPGDVVDMMVMGMARGAGVEDPRARVRRGRCVSPALQGHSPPTASCRAGSLARSSTSRMIREAIRAIRGYQEG